ncbi:MAG TPA: permease-like cell division protein FtsX [Gaiellaceae bacterium]|nr:permease-like cell division protein FtsX [Gaiellaceae bacterium]
MRVKLLVSEAWRSLAANASTTFAATVTVLVGMFIIGLFIAVFTWTDSAANHLKKQLVVQVDFKPTGEPGGPATRAQENAVARMLQANPKVKKITFVSKEEALQIMKRRDPEMVSHLPWNPLPDQLVVTATNADYLGDIAASLQHPLPPGVDKIVQGKQLRGFVLRFAHVIDVLFLVGAVVLAVASTLLIGNTIRLSIFSRRREIEVMKLVGATNWFVRGPFMIEGLICGLGGALLAIFFLVIGKAVALPAIDYQRFVQDSPDVHAWAFPYTALTLIGMSLVLGAVGSGLTVHRFLKV